jgi:beta-N-acetylhexosaminidase
MDAQRGIARRMIIGLPAEGLSPAWERDFAAFPPAGVLLFRRDFKDLEDLRRLTTRLRRLARPRRLFLVMDEEGGFVSQLGGHLVVPPNARLLARGAQPGDIAWAHRVTGQRLRALGVEWSFAPIADVHSEPHNPVIGPRAFGGDPESVARAVGEALDGFRSAGLASCLKHFPGHGDTVLDSHLALPRCDAGRDTLERRELVPFRANLAHANAVMSAHVVYPALDAERPATFSRAITHDLLRERLGFSGIVVTDALEMKGAAEGREPADAARMALDAGCDLLLFAFHDEAVRRVRLELAKALVDGRLRRDGFDAARPRLGEFSAATPEPRGEELALPLEALTPPDWESRLTAIVERGLAIEGRVDAAAPAVAVREPEWAYGPTFRSALEGHGMRVADDAPVGVELVASRTPLGADVLEEMRRRTRARRTVMIAMQNDAFLESVPDAAVRVSATDPTPLTRGVVARVLAERLRGARAR